MNSTTSRTTFSALPLAGKEAIAQTAMTTASTNETEKMNMFQSPVLTSDVFCFITAMTTDAASPTITLTVITRVPKRPHDDRA